jgi:hypothetical protein
MEDRTELGEVAIGGTPFSGPSRPTRTFPRDRVCSEPDCDTQLSIYNEGNYCGLHGRGSAPRLRGKKIA